MYVYLKRLLPSLPLRIRTRRGRCCPHLARTNQERLWERDAAVIISRYFSRLVRLSRLTREKRTQTSVGDWFPWLHKRYDVMWGVAPLE